MRLVCRGLLSLALLAASFYAGRAASSYAWQGRAPVAPPVVKAGQAVVSFTKTEAMAGLRPGDRVDVLWEEDGKVLPLLLDALVIADIPTLDLQVPEEAKADLMNAANHVGQLHFRPTVAPQ